MKKQFNMIITGNLRMYICLCKGVTDSRVRALGRDGVVSPEALAAELGIDRDDCCGRCFAGIENLAAIAEGERLSAIRLAPVGSTRSSS
jgi:bacterioferritin-associated ferredoxin